jgi:hypothetical protein
VSLLTWTCDMQAEESVPGNAMAVEHRFDLAIRMPALTAIALAL